MQLLPAGSRKAAMQRISMSRLTAGTKLAEAALTLFLKKV